MDPIILASSSPRRQELLRLMHIPFQVIIPNTQENFNKHLPLQENIEAIAHNKVQAVINMLPKEQHITWILGADTIIVSDGIILGKPQDQLQAMDYIKRLQGNTHQVLTSVVLYNGKNKEFITKTETAEVTFSKMTKEEIKWYVNTGDWHGAAGGYRIQGLASCFISKIKGTNSCIIGLPIKTVYDMLSSQGYSILE